MDKKRKTGRIVPLDPALRKTKRNKKRRPASFKNPNLEKQENRKKRRRQTESIQEHKRGMAIRRSTTFVAGLFFVAVLIYLVQTLFIFMTTPDIPVEMVRMGTVDTPQVIRGIIIRDETVYYAPRDGVLQFERYNYERVRPGTVVASIQNVQAITGIQNSINQVEEQIMRIQDIRGDVSAVDPAVNMINGRIQNVVDTRLNRHINLDVADAFTLRDSITQNVSFRNQMIVSENISIDAQAGIHHQSLMGQLNINQDTVVVEEGGVLAPLVDGFETTLNFENMYYLTREQTLQGMDYNQMLPRREIRYNDEIFKIINSNRWYIAAYISNDLVENMSAGNWQTIYIEGRSNPLSVRIHHISPGFEESFVIFRSTAYMIDFLNTRSILFKTTDTVQYGLRIANSAITEHAYLAVPLVCVHEDDDDQTYVVRVIGDEDLVIPVTIRRRDDYFAFVSSNTAFLEMGNTLRENVDLSSTRIVSEEQLFSGVYRVVSGIATFTHIHLQNYLSTNEVHTILDPSINPGLRVHDHIVADASLIEDGDIVFSGVR